jgi:hypothetical protein
VSKTGAPRRESLAALRAARDEKTERIGEELTLELDGGDYTIPAMSDWDMRWMTLVRAGDVAGFFELVFPPDAYAALLRMKPTVDDASDLVKLLTASTPPESPASSTS